MQWWLPDVPPEQVNQWLGCSGEVCGQLGVGSGPDGVEREDLASTLVPVLCPRNIP